MLVEWTERTGGQQKLVRLVSLASFQPMASRALDETD